MADCIAQRGSFGASFRPARLRYHFFDIVREHVSHMDDDVKDEFEEKWDEDLTSLLCRCSEARNASSKAGNSCQNCARAGSK